MTILVIHLKMDVDPARNDPEELAEYLLMPAPQYPFELLSAEWAKPGMER